MRGTKDLTSKLTTRNFTTFLIGAWCVAVPGLWYGNYELGFIGGGAMLAFGAFQYWLQSIRRSAKTEKSEELLR